MDTALKQLKRRVEAPGAAQLTRPAPDRHGRGADHGQLPIRVRPGRRRSGWSPRCWRPPGWPAGSPGRVLGSARWDPLGCPRSQCRPAAAAASARRPGERFATGRPECCVCPVCRAIAALRDPSPELAERLATGAGDLAAGVASLLRAFAARRAGRARPRPAAAGTAVGSRGAATTCGARPPVPGMILSRHPSRTCGPPPPAGRARPIRRAAAPPADGCRAGRAGGDPAAGRPSRGARLAGVRRGGRGRTRRRGLTTGHAATAGQRPDAGQHSRGEWQR